MIAAAETASTSLLRKTHLRALPRPSKLGEPISLIRLPVRKSVMFGGFNARKAVSKSMTELVKTPAFGSDSPSEEGVELFQTEAVIDGSGSHSMADGLETALNRVSKWLITAMFTAILIWRHDAEAMWAATGSVANTILSITLKRILNQERPVTTLKSGPGMPSSHAQSIFFIFVFIVLQSVEWLGINELTVVVGAAIMAFGSYLSWLRFSQQFHTINQVVVGAAVGTIFCMLWFGSWNRIVLQAFNSSLWVRMLVVSGACTYCISFVVHAMQYLRKMMTDELLRNEEYN